MANNLHISYDLNSPGQDYNKVIEKIKSLGGWAKIHKSYWYVNSTSSAEEARNTVWSAMDGNDTLYIVDASNNEAAWNNLSKDASTYIKDKWGK